MIEESNKKNRTDILIPRKPNCGLIVIDNFYNNALETRAYILTARIFQ